ncbi:MraY family glycosyltransferase [Actinopolymorpha sp. B11F2]|uniref:MraY family glycosyltransferase n=1 Tax=Actinopolymorpha sp. B11F2 TaxID=3160862 RepID=UPI0032E3D448
MREYVLVLIVAAATTYLLGGVARRFAARIGAVKPIRDRDVHSVLMPRLGGIAVLGGVAAGFVVATHLPFLGMLPEIKEDAWGLLIAGFVIAVVGGIDDVVDLDALTRLAGQVVAAGILVVYGVQLNWLPLPDGTLLSLSPAQSAVISALIIIMMANAVNFVDGLDGLAAGVVFLGAAAFFTYSYGLTVGLSLNRATTATLVTAIMAGACLGFLPHNFFPARVFLGDCGAYLLGLLLAASTISLTGWLDPSVMSSPQNESRSLLPALLPLVLPIAVMALPFIDLLLAVIRRTRAGQSPFAADQKHLHHRLHLELGHSHKGAVLVMYLWAGLLAFGVVVIGLWATWVTASIVGVVVVAAIACTALLPRRNHLPHPR